jgi:hypothetical protein
MLSGRKIKGVTCMYMHYYIALSKPVAGREWSPKNLKNDNKRAVIELWEAKVHLRSIRSQMKISERALRRVLADAKAYRLNPLYPLYPIKSRRAVSGRLRNISMHIRMQKVIVLERGMTRS